MSDKNKTQHEIFNWFNIQKQYLDALSDFNQINPFSGGPSASSKPFNPFDFLKNPYDLFRANMAGAWDKPAGLNIDENQELFDKIFKQWRDYHLFEQQFSKLFEGIANSDGKKSNVTDFINRQFEEMESIFTTAKSDFGWGELMKYYEQTLKLMLSFYTNIVPSFDNLSSHPGFSMTRKAVEQLLDIPGLGYSREMQSSYQELIKLWINCQDRYQEYRVLMAMQGRKALDIMREEIIAKCKKNKTIGSVQEIYSLWVECNEKAYVEYALTDEYAELYGHLVNALIALKKKIHEIMETVLETMNMPTQSAITTLEHRQHDTRQRIKSIQLELAELKRQLKDAKGETEEKIQAGTGKKSRISKPTSTGTLVGDIIQWGGTGSYQPRGARRTWLETMRKFDGKTVQEFCEHVLANPPSTPKRGKLAGQSPMDWLGWAKRKGYIQIVSP